MATLRLDALAVPGLAPASLELGAGDCAGISGPSGSGKSRLLRAIADLDPHGGEVWLDDVACASVPAPRWRRDVTLLPAESAWWHDTAGEHFRLPGALPLERLGLQASQLEQPVSELSTGQRQRLALLRALENRPRALLLDEPTAALDAENIERVEAFVRDYRESAGAVVLWVGHDARQLDRVANRRVAVRDGALVSAA